MTPKRRPVRLYNVILPLWLLIFFPGAWFLWVIVLGGNFLVDSLVLLIGARRLGLENPKELYKRSILKVYGRGFAADFMGVILLVLVFFVLSPLSGPLSDLIAAFVLNPFTHPGALLLTLLAVAESAYFIYDWNHKSFAGLGLTEQQVHKLCLWLAVFTAPWLFLLPAGLFY